jgi:hypothetical protein
LWLGFAIDARRVSQSVKCQSRPAHAGVILANITFSVIAANLIAGEQFDLIFRTEIKIMTKIKIALSTAIVLGLVSAATAMQRDGADFGGVTTASAQQAYMAPAKHKVLPYTIEEKTAFERANHVF